MENASNRAISGDPHGSSNHQKPQANGQLFQLRGFFKDGPPPDVLLKWAQKVAKPSREHFTTPVISSVRRQPLQSLRTPVLHVSDLSVPTRSFRPSSARSNRVLPPGAIAYQLSMTRYSPREMHQFYCGTESPRSQKQQTIR